MNKLNLIFVWSFLLATMLGACGQPGPLYLPKDQPSVYSEPPPVVEPDVGSQELKPDESAPPKTETAK